MGLDFDGTLAPIVEDPGQARPDAGALALLSELSHKLRIIAIVSGRDSDFLAQWLPDDRLVLIGNHGLEERKDGESRVLPEAAPYAPALAAVADAAEALLDTGLSGAIVERKRATVAVHFRRTADPNRAGRWLRPRLAELATANGLELRDGRLVFELRPPIDIDKGRVIDRLVAQSRAGAVLFAGDDRTDLDAFAALKRWKGRGLPTVSVAVRSPEAPAELLADADLVVDGIPGVVQLLGELARSGA